MFLPAITFIYIILAMRATEALETLAGVLVNTINTGGVVSAFVDEAVVNILLAVLTGESILTFTPQHSLNTAIKKGSSDTGESIKRSS